MKLSHKLCLLSLAAWFVVAGRLPLSAQVPDSFQATDELEFFEDYYLQDEAFERRFLGTDDDLDEYGNEVEVERNQNELEYNRNGTEIEVEGYRGPSNDPDTAADLEAGVYRDPDDFEPYGKADFVRQFEVPSQYIDRSDETRNLMPESYGYPHSLEHPHAPVKLRRNSPQWYRTYYRYDRFADGGIDDDDDLEVDLESEGVYRDPDNLEVEVEADRDRGRLYPEAKVKSGLLYDDPDAEFWYERGERPATVNTWAEEDLFGID